MISAKRLLQMARKWRKAAVLGRKRISWTSTKDASSDVNACNTSIAVKGHFIVYSSEGKRFMVPLTFLNTSIFEELLRISEEEFGLQGNGRIMLPCDAVFLEHTLQLLRTRGSRDVEKQMLMSITKKQDCLGCGSELPQMLAVF